MRKRANVLAGALAAVTAAALLSSCAISPDGGAGDTRVASLADSARPTELSPLGTPDSAPKTQRPEEPSRLEASRVRVGSHNRFDRLVVDLEGSGSPGWYVSYVSSPAQETVGRPLNVRGSAFLNINIDGTVYPFEAGMPSAPVEMAGSSGNVVDVVNAGTYEGRTQIVVGLRSEKPYSVQVLNNPTRLVVDILKS